MKKSDAPEAFLAAASVHKPMTRHDVTELVVEARLKKGLTWARIAKVVGELLADKAKAQGIGRVVFDRGGYKYHGRVKALADAARAIHGRRDRVALYLAGW